MLKRSSPHFRVNRKSQMMRWWVLWRVPVLLLIVMAVWWFVVRPFADGRDWVEVDYDFALCGERGAAACVIDGDTLSLRDTSGLRKVRLIGFDAPELDGACAAEQAQARAARIALNDWLKAGPIEWNGGIEPPRDQYGRELRELRRMVANGRSEYLAKHMIEQGLAAENGWGSSPHDWCD